MKAAELTPPAICAACTEPRRGLTAKEQKSAGATGATRVVWLCVDCVELGTLADLAQCETNEGGSVRTYAGMQRRRGAR